MTNLKEPKRTTLSGRIVEQMEQCIADDVWAVGEKIPSELELMEQFGAGRNTVREASASLVYAGILKSVPGDGTYVSSRGKMDAVLQDKLRTAGISDIWETHLVLESSLVRLAAERSTEDELVCMQKIADERRDPGLNDLEFAKIDKKFHLQIAAQSHSTFLYSIYESFLNARYALPEMVRQHEKHDALCSAIISKDGDKAAEIVKELLATEYCSLRENNGK